MEEVEEEEVQDELEPVPNNKEMVLPSGEWYMPDLKNNTMSQVLEDGRDYLEDNTGKILFQFEKLEQYTGYKYYLICPFTGKVDLFDTDTKTCIPIDIQASKEPKPNSVVIAEVTKASQEQRQRSWENKVIPGEDLPVTSVNTPFTTTQLANIMMAFKGLCKVQGEINLDLHNIKLRGRRDKWVKMGFRNMVSNKIRGRLDTIEAMLTNDNIIHTELGKHNYPTPTFDPRTSIIKTAEALGRFNTVVDDICSETINKATTLPARPTIPVQTPIEEVSTPTNTGNNIPLEPRKVAFAEPAQNIQQRLTQLAVNTEPISLLGRTGRPNENSSVPWQNTEQGNKSGCMSRPTENLQGPALSPQSVSSIGQQTNQGNSFKDPRSCFRCAEMGHLKEQCTKSVWCDFCRRNNHSTEACNSKPSSRTTSTPRYPTGRDDAESTHSNTTNTAEESRLEILMKS